MERVWEREMATNVSWGKSSDPALVRGLYQIHVELRQHQAPLWSPYVLSPFQFFLLVLNKEETQQRDRPFCFKKKKRKKRSQTVAFFLSQRNHQSMSYIIQPCRVCMTTQPTNRALFTSRRPQQYDTLLFQTTREKKGAHHKLVRREKRCETHSK